MLIWVPVKPALLKKHRREYPWCLQRKQKANQCQSGMMPLFARNAVESYEKKVASTEVLWGVVITPSAGTLEK